jgi:ribonucleoside-diphosphate reductase alpha chain
MWLEYFVLHSKFKTWFQINKFDLCKKLWLIGDVDIEKLKENDLKTLFELSPYFGSTANEIDWKSAVEMQGRIQRWVDHSISKTINLPADTTKETVAELYITAYEAGCKGVTVYRDGCRNGILMANDKKGEKIEYLNSPKRPQELDCDIYYTSVTGKKYMTIVGLLEGKPYELFAIEPLENTTFPSIIKKGKVIKDGSRRYRLVGNTGDKQYTINSIVWRMTTDERTDTRKYSLMLRHGINPQFISEQIREYANITSFDKMVQRVLDNYVSGYKTKESCPECGEKLIFEEGCLKCKNCGHSKCG